MSRRYEIVSGNAFRIRSDCHMVLTGNCFHDFTVEKLSPASLNHPESRLKSDLKRIPRPPLFHDGNVSSNVVPFPASLLTEMVIDWRLASFFTIASPRPEPPVLELLDSSTR